MQLVTLQSTENPLEFAIVNPHVTHVLTRRSYECVLYTDSTWNAQSQEIPQSSKPCMSAYDEAKAEFADLRIWTMIMIVLHINPVSLHFVINHVFFTIFLLLFVYFFTVFSLRFY